MSAKFRSFEELLEEYLENPEFAMSFLNQALADEDVEAFKLSLKDIIRVHGKISHLVKEAHLSRGTLKWISFFDALNKINFRDCLLAKIALQGGKRIGEVLSLTTDKIDWNVNQITFKQLKTRGSIEETIISYPTSVMNELKQYIGDRQGLVFITRTGKAIPLCQLAVTFEKAGKIANIPFKVTPHVLRASTVTYLKL